MPLGVCFIKITYRYLTVQFYRKALSLVLGKNCTQCTLPPPLLEHLHPLLLIIAHCKAIGYYLLLIYKAKANN